MLTRFNTELLSCILGEWLTASDVVCLDSATSGANRRVLKESFHDFPRYYEDAFDSLCDVSIPLSAIAWMQNRNMAVSVRCLGIHVSDFQVFRSYPERLQELTISSLGMVSLLCLDLIDMDLNDVVQIFHSLCFLTGLICIHGNDFLSSLFQVSSCVVLCEIVNSPQLTDQGLINLYDLFPDLHSLVIKNCIGLTSRVVDHIFHNPRHLSELCIVRCPISVADVAQLEFPNTGIVVAITAGAQSISL